jgi:hypothetical protein
MKHSKYIILDNDLETPIVFSPLLEHVDVAAGKPVISAGMCYRAEDGVFGTYGESVSLQVKSRPEKDPEILNRYLEYDC